MAVMRLLPSNAQIEGSIRYRETNLLELNSHDMLQILGKEIGMIPQNSAMVLNPVMTIGRQITESLVLHEGISSKTADEKAIYLLKRMDIPDPHYALSQYPHEFSGGMRERILIAIVLACEPTLIIADEPTAGLDILVRKQTIELLMEHSRDKTFLLITHDLGTAHELCSRIVVMYAGEIVESGNTREVLSMPMHPYTQGLLTSHPSAGLHPIPGMSPNPGSFPEGCRFYTRCSSVQDLCTKEHPSLKETGKMRKVRCLRYD